MIATDRVKIIQDLQCRHASWLAKYNQSLSLGECADKWVNNNIAISNYIKVLYRYIPFTYTVTNADSVTITIIPNDTVQTYNISISYNGESLVNFSGTGTQETIIDEIVTFINTGTNSHEYYCVNDNNTLYLYTYGNTAAFGDVPLVTISESYNNIVELSYESNSISEDDLYVISDLWNCISEDDLCDIVCKIKSLMDNCNCN